MTVSKFTLTEIIKISNLSIDDLANKLRGMSVKEAMAFRRNIQVGIANYSKGKQGKIDETMTKLLVVCQKIEKWCRLRYFERYLPKGLVYTQRQKEKVKTDWEAIIHANSY